MKLRPGMVVMIFRSVDFFCAHGQGTILKETLWLVTVKRLGTHFCGVSQLAIRGLDSVNLPEATIMEITAD